MLTPNLQLHLSQTLTSALDDRVVIDTFHRVSGGDINEAYKVIANKGNYFLKLNSSRLGNVFEAEARGLSLLSRAGAIYIPAPIAHGRYEQTVFLLLPFIERGKPSEAFWKNFAEGLANLHRQSQTYFGLDHNNFIGPLPQLNTPTAEWSEFYAMCRLLPLGKILFDRGDYNATDISNLEKLTSKLNQLFPTEPPALLHGDLWAGNYMIMYNSQPCIFDPAVYYGHREMELAMMQLFGGFDSSVFNYYNDAYPLQAGWRNRIQLCQLYTLLVHAVLFRGHYIQSCRQIVSRYC